MSGKPAEKFKDCPRCAKTGDKGRLVIVREDRQSGASEQVVKCVICSYRLTDAELDVLRKEATARAEKKKQQGGGKPKLPCKCCKRVMPVIGRGLCWKCYATHRDAGTLDDLYPKSCGTSTVTKKTKPSKKAAEMDVEPIEPETAAPVSTPPADQDHIVLAIPFKDNDEKLFEKLVDAANRNRRSVHNEILHHLDMAMEVSR